MSIKLRIGLGSAATPRIALGIITSLAIFSPMPQAIASVATASSIASNAATSAAAQPCETHRDGTILSDATASLAALGSDAPLAQASVLILGLGCLAGGGLWLKRHCH